MKRERLLYTVRSLPVPPSAAFGSLLRLPGLLLVFLRHRWIGRLGGRAALRRRQRRRLRRLLRRVSRTVPRYAAVRDLRLSALPILDKAQRMDHFEAGNAPGLGLERALRTALEAERSRDFSAQIDGVTVGLSSGTSGSRGVFLVSAAERAEWAVTVLARLLPGALLRRVASPWRPPLRIGFVLRASSRLYESLASRRIRFRFVDLVASFERVREELCAFRPDVLVAPASVLRELARHEHRPSGVSLLVSVAEPLAGEERLEVERAFGAPCRRVYQASEGLIGIDCERGRMHLLEEQLLVERLPVAGSHDRFQPVLTDLRRLTQPHIRVRLDDVLRADPSGRCPCGRPSAVLAEVEGRADEVLWLERAVGEGTAPVFPDVLRRALATVEGVRNWRVRAAEARWTLELDGDEPSRPLAAAAIRELCERLGLRPPRLRFTAWAPEPPGAKRRRILHGADACPAPHGDSISSYSS